MVQWCEADHAHMWSDRHRPTDIGHTHDNYRLCKWFAQDRPNCSVIGHIFVLHTHTSAHSYFMILLEYSAEFSCVLQVTIRQQKSDWHEQEIAIRYLVHSKKCYVPIAIAIEMQQVSCVP